MAENNVGRSSRIKHAVAAYLLNGIAEFQPITRQLASFIQREQQQKLAIVPARMVDNVESILSNYWENKQQAIDTPLPMLFLAFGKAMRPAPPSRGWSIAESQAMKLKHDSGYYDCRLAFKEWDCQLVFMAHEQETAVAMCDYLRLYLQRFENHRFPIKWHYQGHDFETFGMLNDGFEPEEIVVDVGSGNRTNIQVYAWNFPIGFMIPYIQGNASAGIQQVNMNIVMDSHLEQSSLFGVVNRQIDKEIGDWENHANQTGK